MQKKLNLPSKRAIDHTEVIMFCSNCGSKLADGAKFCSECGTRVSRPEPEFRTFADLDFTEPEDAKKTVEAPETERPVREKVSFDWSNVVDEPHKKEIPDIKSPWGTTGSIDEKELFAEMSNPGGKSRTMSFIDVLKAEKEERERAAADKAIEYTEVLHFDQDFGPFDELQGVKFAPLYDDVDEPVKTPFDDPDFNRPEPVVEDEPRYEEAPAPIEYNGLEEPEESELELSRETIAQFDEFVKSFEKEAGIAEDEPVFEEPAVEAPVVEEPAVSAPKFELPDFLKKIADFAKEEEPAVAEPVFEEPAPEEPEFADDGFLSDEPAVIELEEEPEVEEPVFEEPVFEEPKYDEAEPEEEPAEEPAELSMEDLYLDLDESETTGKFGTRYDLNKYDYEEEEEEAEEEEEEAIDEDELFKEMEESKAEKPSMTIAPPADKESEIEALRKRLAELTGVNMYDPEDLEEEEEELPIEEPEEEPEDELFVEPSDDIFEEPEEEPAEEPVEEPAEEKHDTFAFEVEMTPELDDFFANLEPACAAASVAEFAFHPELTPEIDEFFAKLRPASAAAVKVPVETEPEPVVEAEPEPVVEAEPEPVVEAEPAVEDIYLQEEAVEEPKPEMPKAPLAPEIPEELIEEEVPDLFVKVEEPEAPAVEEVIEEAVAEIEVPAEEPVVEEVIEEVAVEAPAEAKETDALSLEELERDLFGDSLDEEVEAEETKKIDKFYTLYRKNEEFQRLLDEEYEKLKHGGGLTEEEKQAVDAIPKMADVEAATKAAAEAKPEPAPAPAPEAKEVPVEKEKAYRQVEDETIYMPKEALEEQLKVDFANAAAAKAPAEVPADSAKKDDKKKVEVEYEDVEHGSKFLTILAVIIALILIMLLAVILILQIAPDSAAAAWIDSLIESITARFSMIPPGGGLTLL